LTQWQLENQDDGTTQYLHPISGRRLHKLNSPSYISKKNPDLQMTPSIVNDNDHPSRER